MSTFIGQLIGFAAIVLLVWRYVVPPVRNMMTARQDAVRQQLKDSEKAARAPHRVDRGPQQGRGSRQGRGGAGRRRGQGGRGTDHRTATGPGRDRGGTHQSAGRPPGRTAAGPAEPSASPGARPRICPPGRGIGAQLRRRRGAAVGHRRSLPGRARCHGAGGGRRRVPADGEDALGQSAGADECDGSVRRHSQGP